MNSQSWHNNKRLWSFSSARIDCVLKRVVIFWRLKTDPTIYFSDFSRLSLLRDYLNVYANLSLYIVLQLT